MTTIGGVATLTIENDVAGELKLSPPAIRLLYRLVERGGEAPFSWEGIPNEQREMIADLIVAEIVKEVEYVTHALEVHGKLKLRLTDKGRNVIELHSKRRIVASAVKSIEVPS